MFKDDEFLFKDETYAIIGRCLEVHRTLGPGFLEAVYQEAMAIEFETAGISYEREKDIDISYKGKILKKKYACDFLCYGEIIVETKALGALAPEHCSQLLNYLKATGKHIGLLVNFGTTSLEWKRLAF